jgi:hypothetical protein
VCWHMREELRFAWWFELDEVVHMWHACLPARDDAIGRVYSRGGGSRVGGGLV